MAWQKVGDWKKVTNLVANIGKEMLAAQKISLMRVGLKAEGTAKKHISQQDLGWKPLKPATIAYKIRKGYSENILVMTSSYFQSITSWVVNDTVYAGVKRGVVHKKSGTEMGIIARVHEYGSLSGKIPARPLWQPTMEETIEWHLSKNSPVDIFVERMKKYH